MARMGWQKKNIKKNILAEYVLREEGFPVQV